VFQAMRADEQIVRIALRCCSYRQEHDQRRFNNNKRSNIMRRIVIVALGLLSVAVAAAPASAQYYGYGPGPGYDGYYGRPYYRAYPREYGAYGYYGPRRYAGGNFLTPRLDPNTGGTYCVDRRFTVQSGVCKPYRGY
jgi:hypothetical protein